MAFDKTGMLMLVALLGAGCQGLQMTRSCDLRESDDHCQEYGVYGPDLLALQGTCEAVGGEWGSEGCPREGILAGCKDVDPSNPWSVTRWFYANGDDLNTADDVAGECEEGTEEFVEAPGG